MRQTRPGGNRRPQASRHIEQFRATRRVEARNPDLDYRQPVQGVAYRVARAASDNRPAVMGDERSRNPDALNSRQVDVGVLFTPSVGERVESLTLFTERLMLAVDEAHPLSSRAAVFWADMRHLQLLVRSWDGSQTYREI